MYIVEKMLKQTHITNSKQLWTLTVDDLGNVKEKFGLTLEEAQEAYKRYTAERDQLQSTIHKKHFLYAKDEQFTLTDAKQIILNCTAKMHYVQEQEKDLTQMENPEHKKNAWARNVCSSADIKLFTRCL